MGHFADAARRAFAHLGAATEKAERDAENEDVQLFQIAERTEDSHRAVVASATDVIAYANQTKMAFDSAVKERDRLKRLAGLALQQIEAAKSADMPEDERTKLIDEKTSAAQSLAIKLAAAKRDVERTQAAAEKAEAARVRAKGNVQTHKDVVHQQMQAAAEVHGELLQAKLAEHMHDAMGTMEVAMDNDDGPSFAEVQAKVQARLAHANAADELDQDSDALAELRVEQDATRAEADTELDALRAELGIGLEPTAASTAEPVSAAAG